jgi:hypothetical protein
MFHIHLERILSDYPNLGAMLEDLSIDVSSYQCVKRNKTGTFNPKKGVKAYRAFQLLEKHGYVERKPMNIGNVA